MYSGFREHNRIRRAHATARRESTGARREAEARRWTEEDRETASRWKADGAGVVTGLGKIEGHPTVVVANDATVKAGAWWPETITKILRALEIAMRNRVPIVYLVDSAGVNLPLQDGIFPGQY